MIIDWNNFTPLSALAGGILIGISASLLILLNGRLAGISSLVGGLIKPSANDMGWRVAFIIGLIVAPLIWQLFSHLPVIVINTNNGLLITSGLIVGIGTRYGSGCTSGHGICGLSRLSPRSFIATLAFMSTGFLTVFVIRHLLVV